MKKHREKLKVLLVDDESPYRSSLATRLALRGFDILEAESGEEGVRQVRNNAQIDAVVLDKKMPGMDGTSTLAEMKIYRPEIPVIMLTGFGSMESALKHGKLGVFRYLSKPVALEELISTIEEAAQEKGHAMAKLDMPAHKKFHWKSRLAGSHNLRPWVIILGFVILVAALLCPPPKKLTTLLAAPKTGSPEKDIMMGYPGYGAIPLGASIASRFQQEYQLPEVNAANQVEHLARRALVMVGLILVAALFWATGAMPMGVTALLVAVVMYGTGVMRPDDIAKAFAKDAVVFIFGVLAFSRVIVSTGLDRRLARLLLLPVRNLPLLLFVFLPLFALSCSFISESILIALLMPLFITVHKELKGQMKEGADPEEHRRLLVMFALMLCYASNVGGPGSPAAGGRNAVMIGILSDYGQAPTFLQWMKYGLPFVPLAALAVGMYFFVAFGPRLGVPHLNVAAIARHSSDRLGPMNREEYLTASVSVLVVLMWIFGSGRWGMGGPILLGLVLLNLLGVMRWREVTRIHWDVVFLYGGASALGKGMAVTGGALFMARQAMGLFPAEILAGESQGIVSQSVLPMAVSLFAGLVTNIMSDGATVAAVGPIAVPMAQNAGLHPWTLGFATAFASSFPHMLIIGTPANALVYILCKDVRTGRQLVTQKDFLKHGLLVFLLSFVVLWGWAFLGYWQWLGFN